MNLFQAVDEKVIFNFVNYNGVPSIISSLNMIQAIRMLVFLTHSALWISEKKTWIPEFFAYSLQKICI
jgi:hypothetical protein